MTNLNRRQLLMVGAAALAAPSIVRAQASTVRIGAVLSQQGAFAVYGQTAVLGAQVAIDMAGKKVLGRPIELVTYDDPDAHGAVQSMRKLIETEKVCAVFGGMFSASAGAIAAYGSQAKMPTMIIQAAVRDLTGKDCNQYVFRTNSYTEIYADRVAPEVLSMGKKWYFLVGAYAYGQEVYQLMRDRALRAGGADLGMDATQIGTTDFSSYILKIRQAKPDVVILGISGGDLAAFLRQYAEFQMDIPLSVVALGDEELAALGPTPPKMIVGKYWHWNNPDNSDEQKSMNAAVMKAQGRPAPIGTAAAWISVRALLAGIEKAGSLEPLAIAQGVEAARPSGIGGYYRDWDHQMMWQPVVGEIKSKITDKYDPLTVISKPLSEGEVLKLYGTRQDSACKMERA
jgi:branched-chain amino acid transport system substrate-binding protein